MKKQPSSILRGILITGLFFFILSPVTAQKEKEEPLITQDHVDKINAIVKPLKDQFDKQLNQDKTYLDYLNDVKKIAEAKSMSEKRSLTTKLEGKYSAFFQKIWSSAKVDEKAYQEKIRAVFPERFGKLIEFGSFLSFSADVSAEVDQVPAPPVLADVCLDICPIAAGEIIGESALLAGGGGDYGDCFLNTIVWSAIVGLNTLNGYLKNNITIPGTLPDDNRKLRVKKSYKLKEEATSFASPGGGFAIAALYTYKTRETLVAGAPLLWLSHQTHIKTINEEYVLEKREIAKSIFNTYASVLSYVISGSWSYVECTSIKWSICEEK